MHVSHVIVTLTYSRPHDNCTDPNSGEMLERATETAYRSFFFYVLGTYKKNQKYLHRPHLFSSFFFFGNSNPNSWKNVCGFNSLRSGPTRPLLVMISSRASELSTTRSKTFFPETFMFQEIIHLGKESKNHSVSDNKWNIDEEERKIVFFPMYML